MKEKEESNLEYGFRNTVESLLREFPQAFALVAYCTPPNKEWKKKAYEAMEVNWQTAAPLLEIILNEGSEFGPEAGAGSPKWLSKIPSYHLAREKWDFLVAHQRVVEYILKAPKLDSLTTHILKHPSFIKNPAGEMSLFDRLLILVLLYNLAYTNDVKEILPGVEALMRQQILDWIHNPTLLENEVTIHEVLTLVAGPELGVPPPEGKRPTN